MFYNNKRQHIVDNNGRLLAKTNSNSSIKHIIKPKYRWIKIFVLILFLVAISSFFWVGASAFSNISKIFTNNTGQTAPFLSFLGNIRPDQLKGEGDSRINLLLIGIGGSNHPGGQLADTIIVASVNPKDKNIVLLSIPRDLYVTIPGYGSDKINSAHSTGVRYEKETGGGPALLKKTVSTVFDIPIHYYIRADFVGFVKLIDTIGGITMDVPREISDPYYPASNMVDYDPFYIQAGQQNLNGQTALKYVRSRETTSDFDRAQRQQLALEAVKGKTLSAGVLSNPKKLTDILQILGDHLRTDLQPNEMERLFSIIKDISGDKITNKVLDNSSGGLLTSNTELGGYYLVPKAGIGNFKDIQAMVHQFFTDPYLVAENARIEILNASITPGQATEVSNILKNYGYSVVKIGDSDKQLSESIIYDYSNGSKPFTTQFLANRFSASVVKQPQKTNSNIDITILIGNDYKQ